MYENALVFLAELVFCRRHFMHVLNRSLCLPPSACFPVSRNRFEMYLDRSLDDGKLVSVYPQDVIESRCLDCCLRFFGNTSLSIPVSSQTSFPDHLLNLFHSLHDCRVV